MVKVAVIKTGGKQYLVKENDIITVDHIDTPEKGKVYLETLAVFDEKELFKLGTPALDIKTQSEVVGQTRGDKIRVARFKSKVRYRKVKGFKSFLTKLQITKIE
ncbi:50S ribosomal protein L21 [Candidatus Roizmanbacteria bacterium CG_4_10_14_0_8_um_filter_33_9]|uniref:50S ribosomal protein L21 n=1 Tax=Candidatus Roizmanbacteria bacterium CG_4_10_14_0_8_um_filter_33_9 TaxID=1974826 RepID=A0A2M7QIE3_9BACT|nr:MAG: 50S ribosomal protein L21 [Candidatus Roizmanbacteria bacterium CG_4_10_14_0_8_um_filter_33_9]